jgi:ssDNA-binding replication factor A large subunit
VVELTAAPTDANATVVGDSTIDVSSGDTLMTVIVVTAENGGQKKYEVTVYPFVSETSVKPEEAQELGIKLFPNPASDMIYIEAEAEISQVTVFNAIGRVVLDQTYRNNQRVQLNVGSLIPGLYMIRVDSEGQSAMVKLLKR